VSVEEDAPVSLRWVIGVEPDARGSCEKSCDGDAGFEAGQWRADAEVETTAERQVGPGRRVAWPVVQVSAVIG
jgi:hypothetical protein